jgi:hypothetical protein
MIVFNEGVMSNNGRRTYFMGGIYNDRYEGTSRGRKLYING